PERFPSGDRQQRQCQKSDSGYGRCRDYHDRLLETVAQLTKPASCQGGPTCALQPEPQCGRGLVRDPVDINDGNRPCAPGISQGRARRPCGIAITLLRSSPCGLAPNAARTWKTISKSAGPAAATRMAHPTLISSRSGKASWATRRISVNKLSGAKRT